jgi:opacity protein-like surface antigen
MKKIIASTFLTFMLLGWASSIKAQAVIDLESGAVFTGYNDVRIPGDDGTLFSLKDDLSPKTEPFYRIRLNYTIKSRHTLSLLYAPLETKSEGSVANDIFFEGVVFPGSTELVGTYKFNSYRFTYRYNFVIKPKFEFGLGFTAKIRDAKISLSSPDLYSEKTNVGFVPIINFRLLWKMDDKFGILLDGDALAAPQGRAEDILIAATYKLSDNFGIRAGYRILEGGAENDEVYNFALFHYASVGISYTFSNKSKSN